MLESPEDCPLVLIIFCKVTFCVIVNLQRKWFSVGVSAAMKPYSHITKPTVVSWLPMNFLCTLSYSQTSLLKELSFLCVSASSAALFEILGGYFSRVFGKRSFFDCWINSVCFLWPFARQCCTWDYNSVEKDSFNDGLLFLRGQSFLYTVKNPLNLLNLEIKDLKKCRDSYFGRFPLNCPVFSLHLN